MEKRDRIPSGVPEGFAPTGAEGLSPEQVQERKRQGLGNETKDDAGKSVGQIVTENLFTLFNLINVALAVCLALVGSWRNMMFMGVVIANTLISTVQEIRAYRFIRKLKLMNIPVAHAIRGGKQTPLNPAQLVKDDLIVLHAGDQVPADALVRSGEGAVDESLLTGESDPVAKVEKEWLLSGSFITEGRFVAQLVHVGEESYAARLTRSARRVKRPKSMLMRDIDRLLKYVVYLLVPMGLLLFAKQYLLRHMPLERTVTSCVAAMIGMIPEGLALLTSIAMAVGVMRMGKRGALIQELSGIETLSRADVLCLDKTGTLTTGEMALEEFVPLEADEDTLRASLARLLGAFDEDTATLRALREAVTPANERPVSTVPFSAKRKMSEATFADGVTIAMGAPEFMGGVMAKPATAERVERYTNRGRRVLAIVRQNQGRARRVLGLAVLTDRMRHNVRETLEYFEKQGVAIKIISGDAPRTVSTLALSAGLKNADQWVDAMTLHDEKALARAARDCTVFGRVTPQQKEALIRLMKKAGHNVAMAGDGVNDIPALKAADCSIALPGGSDAARQTAQVTLLNGDFSTLPRIVDEGRRVVGNITRSASLFLMKTLYSFALTALLLLLPAAYPFQPIQLTLVSGLCIGLPGFFLALEPAYERSAGDFLKTVLSRALPGAVAVALCASTAMLLEKLGYSFETCSTLATLAAGAMGINQLASVCVPFTKLRAAVLAGVSTLLVLAVLLLPGVFYLERLKGSEIALLSGFIALGYAVMLVVRRLVRKKRERPNGASS